MADLTTLSNLRSWLGVTGNSDDVLLTRLVTAASAYVETYISRKILTASYTETVDGNGGDRQILRNYPIQSVSAVTISGAVIPISTAWNVAGYQNDDIGVTLIGYTFSRARRNVTVAYTAGFTTVPLDIEQCVLDMCSLRYRERDRIGFVSKSLAGETVTFMVKDMSDSVRTILNNYRRVFPE
jgi:uncharacterized phiE125 gp8 family phage protein